MVINKRLLQIFLFLSVISLFSHLYISFFQKDLCSWNMGIAFGLVDFLPQQYLILIMIFSAFSIAFFIWKFYGKYYLVIIAFLLPVLGNILDRVFHGGVCDYINLRLFVGFPIFNLNDIFILVSLSLILVIIFYESACCKRK